MVYSGSQEAPPPQYRSTGSLHQDLENIRRRNASHNNDTAAHPPADSLAPPQPPASSLEIRRNELPDYRTTADSQREQTLAISDFIVDDDDDTDAIREQMEADVVAALFRAIENGQDDIVNAFVSSGLAKVDTRDVSNRTPLGVAAENGHIRIVQQLMDMGADVNEFSSYYSTHPDYSERVDRTPLMIACEKGNLPLVKLLLDVYHCDDSIIAPDGQLALRVASFFKHREIVDYLPIRRGGGMKRWKYKNRRAIRHIKAAGKGIYRGCKLLVYDIPKCLIWELPYHLIFKPLWKRLKFLYNNRDKLAGWVWDWLKRTTKATYIFIKKLPARTWKFAKAFSKWLIKAAKETFKGLKSFSKWLWKKTVELITVSIPKVTKQTLEFIWSTIVKFTKLLADFVVQVLSAIHTLVMYVFRFIKDLTFADVMNGFKAVLKFIFVATPLWLWHHIVETCGFFGKVLKTAFGLLGVLIIDIVNILRDVLLYFPKLIWRILCNLGDIGKRGTDEVRIWFNPKAAV